MIRISIALILSLVTTTKSLSWNHLPTTKQSNHHHRSSSKIPLFRLKPLKNSAGDNDNDDQDLFDYFDPLLSPHAYPNGISPDKKPSKETMTTSTNGSTSNSSTTKKFGMNVLGMDQQQQESVKEEFPTEMTTNKAAAEQDLFDYFDPLKSPHEYPNGISPTVSEEVANEQSRSSSNKKQYSMNVFGMDDSKPPPLEVVQQESPPSPESSSSSSKSDDQDLFDYFDPLKSPHEYPNGISPNNAEQVEDDRYNPLALGRKKGKKEETVEKQNGGGGSGKLGILLMDHGSRNEASNKRLEHLAELYQLTMEGENIVVSAAHMEIASPSIPDGLERLLKAGVDEIVCHPYFLSPGRHVREDIPEIVDAAIASLNIKIPVITTDPVGSNTQLMIGAIHSSVREKSQLMRKQNES